MKTVVLCGITLLAAATASAQTSTSATAADQPAKTVTLTGCVGGGSESKPITLSNALVVPTTTQPGLPDQVPSPVPPAVSVTGTQPADPTAPPPSATPAVPAPAMPPSPAGTSGTKTSSTPVGTSGIVTGTAPAGSSGSTLTGYRLSGADMQPWIGKRVQVIGTFVPAAPPSPAPSVTGAAAAPPVLEFRVQTVMPTSGPCPK
jgi:hypothetical protein